MQTGFAQIGLIKACVVDPRQRQAAPFNKNRLTEIAIAQVSLGKVQRAQFGLVEGDARQDRTAQHALLEHQTQG